MAESNNDYVTDKPLFEILDFVPNEENTKTDKESGKLTFLTTKVGKQDPRTITIGEKLCGVKKDKNGGFVPIPKEEKTPINLYEAAIFCAYFGVPNEGAEKEKWLEMSFSDKVTFIENRLSKRATAKSFTKIL
ncbi:hypothetical protein K0B04_00485 [Patescibacteria group bacterium]|nr:hypothetical protein [Patescibacteria group bacterium]